MNFRNLMRFHWKDYRKNVYILIAVLLVVDIAQVVLGLLFPSRMADIGQLFGLNRGIIIISSAIGAIVTATMTFPLLISFGVTRRNFYLTALLSILLFCSGFALVESLLFTISKLVLPGYGVDVPSNISFPIHWYVLTVSLITVSLIFLVIGAGFYRLGALKGILSLVIFIFILNVVSNILPSIDFMAEPGERPFLSDTWALCGITAVMAAVGWLFLRRAPVKS